jgi:general secretion pathway protein G
MRSIYLKICRIGLIIGVLAVGHRTEVRREQYARARSDISALRSELKHYWNDNGSYPTTDQGLLLLFNMTYFDPGIVRPPQPGLPLNPQDPWGNSYFYQSDGDSYVLGSFGPRESGVPDPLLFVHSTILR